MMRAPSISLKPEIVLVVRAVCCGRDYKCQHELVSVSYTTCRSLSKNQSSRGGAAVYGLLQIG
jgi:hypothetical protein